MTLRDYAPIGYTPEGKLSVRALIFAHAVPDPLPENGADIDGMSANEVFAPLSCLYILGNAPEKCFIADESGHFVPAL